MRVVSNNKILNNSSGKRSGLTPTRNPLCGAYRWWVIESSLSSRVCVNPVVLLQISVASHSQVSSHLTHPHLASHPQLVLISHIRGHDSTHWGGGHKLASISVWNISQKGKKWCESLTAVLRRAQYHMLWSAEIPPKWKTYYTVHCCIIFDIFFHFDPFVFCASKVWCYRCLRRLLFGSLPHFFGSYYIWSQRGHPNILQRL